MRKQFFFCFVCSLLIQQSLVAQDSTRNRIDNAYYLAKALINYTETKKDPGFTRLVLGGVLWYMVDDENPDPEQNERVMDKYPVVQKYYDSLKIIFRNDNEIFEIGMDVLENCIRQKFNLQDRPFPPYIKKFIDLRQEYTNLYYFIDSVIKEKKTLNNYSQAYDKYLKDERAKLERIKAQSIVDSINIINATIAKYDSLFKKTTKENNRLSGVLQTQQIELKNLRKEIKDLKITTKIELACLINPGVSATRVNELVSEQGWMEYKETLIKGEQMKEQTEVSSLSFKLPSQSEIIDALAIYLAKRVKQESVMWFFETLQRNVKFNELVQTFFPETIALLQSKEVYEIPNLGSAWRYALSKDFVYMPKNLFRSHWFRSKLGQDTLGIANALELTWDIARMVEQKYPYNDMISSLYLQNNTFNQSTHLTFTDLLSVLYAANNEFIKKEESVSGWLKYEDLVYMNDDELMVMLSLVNARYHTVFSKLTGMPDSLEFNFEKQKLVQFRRWLGLLLLKVEQVDKLKKQYQVVTKEGLAKFEYSDYNTWKFLQDLISTFNVNENKSNFGDLFSNMDKNIIPVLDAIVRVQEVYSLLQQKNFAGAVDVVLHTINSLIVRPDYTMQRDEITKLLSRYKYRMPEDPIKANAYLEKLGGKIEANSVKFSNSTLLAYLIKRDDQKAIQTIRNLAGFLNDVAQADNSKLLARVVESYAMPPGSYKKKRNSWKSLDLAAYVGMYAGYEQSETGIKGQRNSGWVYGLTAPLGLSFSKTFGKKAKGDYQYSELQNPALIKIGSNDLWRRSSTTLTLFASVIDIGAVVSYRFNNQDTILPQNVKWSQVLSPGIHLGIGIKNTPLVFSAGMQYTPDLRSFKRDPDQKDAIRYYTGFLFDIPLFNLWTRSEVVRMKKK